MAQDPRAILSLKIRSLNQIDEDSVNKFFSMIEINGNIVEDAYARTLFCQYLIRYPVHDNYWNFYLERTKDLDKCLASLRPIVGMFVPVSDLVSIIIHYVDPMYKR